MTSINEYGWGRFWYSRVYLSLLLLLLPDQCCSASEFFFKLDIGPDNRQDFVKLRNGHVELSMKENLVRAQFQNSITIGLIYLLFTRSTVTGCTWNRRFFRRIRLNFKAQSWQHQHVVTVIHYQPFYSLDINVNINVTWRINSTTSQSTARPFPAHPSETYVWTSLKCLSTEFCQCCRRNIRLHCRLSNFANVYKTVIVYTSIDVWSITNRWASFLGRSTLYLSVCLSVSSLWWMSLLDVFTCRQFVRVAFCTKMTTLSARKWCTPSSVTTDFLLCIAVYTDVIFCQL